MYATLYADITTTESAKNGDSHATKSVFKGKKVTLDELLNFLQEYGLWEPSQYPVIKNKCGGLWWTTVANGEDFFSDYPVKGEILSIRFSLHLRRKRKLDTKLSPTVLWRIHQLMIERGLIV